MKLKLISTGFHEKSVKDFSTIHQEFTALGRPLEFKENESPQPHSNRTESE